MDRTDTDHLNIQMPPVTEDSSINRYIRLPFCVASGLASVIPIFCIGLLYGAVGGLLLGGTAVVVLQSLELLADNRLLMEQLEKYIMDDYYLEEKAKEMLQWESYNQVHNIHISLFAVMFGVFSSTVSLGLGVCIGLLTYSHVIKKKGEAEMEKALGVAGLVCLMVVTATGYMLGLTLESFLHIAFNLSILLWFIISVVVVFLGALIADITRDKSHFKFDPFSIIYFTPGIAFVTFLMSFLSNLRLNFLTVVNPVIIVGIILHKSNSLQITAVSVPLMLIISDIYNIAGQRIVSLQSARSTDTSSVVVEAIFVGVLHSLLWMVTGGMSSFSSLKRGEADKITVFAPAGSGAAVLGVIKLALPVLGPGPTIGAVMGVAGAVGVSLSAAVAATDQNREVVDHYGLVGRLGVTVGAAIVAFLSSLAHNGLSGMFMGLCAATIPAGATLKLLISDSKSWPRTFFVILLIPPVLISLTYISLFYISFMSSLRVICAYYLCIICAGFLHYFIY